MKDFDFDVFDVLLDSPHFRANTIRYDEGIKDAQNLLNQMSSQGLNQAKELDSQSEIRDTFAGLVHNALSEAKWESENKHIVSSYLYSISKEEKAASERLQEAFGSQRLGQHLKIEQHLQSAKKYYDASVKDLENGSYKFFKEKRKKSFTNEEISAFTAEYSNCRYKNQMCGLKYAQAMVDSFSLAECDLVDLCLQYVDHTIKLQENLMEQLKNMKPALVLLSKELEEKQEKRNRSMELFYDVIANHNSESLLDAKSEYNIAEAASAKDGAMKGYLFFHPKACVGSVNYDSSDNSPLKIATNAKRLSQGHHKKEKKTNSLKKLGSSSSLIDVKSEYCIIKNGNFIMYGEKDLTTPREQISLKDCLLVYKFKDKYDRPFAFEIHTKTHSFYLQAHSPIETEHWIATLSTCAQQTNSASKREIRELQGLSGKSNPSSSPSNSQLSGKLTLELHNATNLPKREMDIHAIINIGKQQIKTDKKKKTRQPVWNEQYIFDLLSDSKTLEITFFDTSSAFWSKGSVGTATLNIAGMQEGSVMKRTLPIMHDKKACGEVSVSLQTTAVNSGKLSINDFDLINVIGKGSYGKVIQARKNDTKQLYAIKVVKKIDILGVSDTLSAKAIKRERDVMAKINHPFLMSLQFAFQSETKLYYVLNFVNGGELYFHLQQVGKFELPRARFYAAEILLALEYLHNLDIIYRDLKAENILLDFHGHVCLIDFGLCKENAEGQTNTLCGTPDYVAPEVFEQVYGKEIDWWSFGVLLWEMIFAKPPFHDNDINGVFKNVLKKNIEIELDMLEEKHEISLELRDILLSLLKRNPQQRLGHNGGEEIKSHVFFKDIDFDALVNGDVIPPFRPKVDSEDDTRNFDSKYLQHTPRDTLEVSNLSSEQQSLFRGFTFTLDNSKGKTLAESLKVKTTPLATINAGVSLSSSSELMGSDGDTDTNNNNLNINSTLSLASNSAESATFDDVLSPPPNSTNNQRPPIPFSSPSFPVGKAQPPFPTAQSTFSMRTQPINQPPPPQTDGGGFNVPGALPKRLSNNVEDIHGYNTPQRSPSTTYNKQGMPHRPSRAPPPNPNPATALHKINPAAAAAVASSSSPSSKPPPPRPGKKAPVVVNNLNQPYGELHGTEHENPNT